MTAILDSIVRSQRYVSVQNGILKYIVRADRMNDDPRIISYGINPVTLHFLAGKSTLVRAVAAIMTSTTPIFQQ